MSSPNAASTTAILLWQTNIAVGEASSAVSAEYRIHRVLSLEHLRTPQLSGTFRLESIDEADTVGAVHAASLGRFTFRCFFAYARLMGLVCLTNLVTRYPPMPPKQIDLRDLLIFSVPR